MIASDEGRYGMIAGYARVSTLEQNEQLQTDALTGAGCGRQFVDHVSGARAHRPELDHLLDVVRESDTLIMWKLDRLGRSVQNLVDLMNLLQSRGVGFKSLTENMDTTTQGGVLIFNVWAIRARPDPRTHQRRTAGSQGTRPSGRPPLQVEREAADTDPRTLQKPLADGPGDRRPISGQSQDHLCLSESLSQHKATGARH